MREIKFRAWDGEKMHYNINRIHFGKDGVPYAALLWNEGLLIKPRPTFMQFTGLLDKNGKEIYESDILIHDGHGEMTTVVFSDGSFLAKRKYGDDELAFIISESVLVLGNIYENPELVEAK